MLSIDRETLDLIGGKDVLDAEISAYREALAAHALTVDVPAPMARPLVERLVRFHGGEYQITEPETGAPEGSPSTLEARVAELEKKLAALTAKA